MPRTPVHPSSDLGPDARSEGGASCSAPHRGGGHVRLPSGGRLGALLGFTALLVAPLAGGAQFVEDPLVPRGAFLLQVEGSYTEAARLFGPGGERVEYGIPFFQLPTTPETFPALEPAETRMRALTGRDDLTLSVGTVRGRFEANDQAVPLRLGWGALERVTVGATVPFVRRRADASLLLSPEGANMGANPAVGPGGQAVGAFRSGAEAALEVLRLQVAQVCDEEGQDSPACLEGLDAEARVEELLDLLGAAWDEADLFPMVGSDAGSALLVRWNEARADLAAWGAEGPETVPLATRPMSGEAFRAGLVGPVWGTDGFPVETPRAFLELGDVELHLVLGLVREDAAARAGFRVRSAVQGTLRFGTGSPDSLALLVPLDPPRGYGGASLRWVNDLLYGDRFGALADLGWTTYREREIVLRGTDRANPWNPTGSRVPVRGSPGDRLRIGLTPRFILAEGLSLGGGYEWFRAGEGSWTPLSPGAPAPDPLAGWTQHRAAVELRFAGRDPPVVGRLPFPLELRARSTWAFSGTEGAPVDRRLEMGARVLRRR